MADISAPEKAAIRTDPIREFSQKVCRYFLDFLETDFRRQSMPRRRVQLKNDLGQTTAIALRKYPNLYQSVWALANRPTGEKLQIRIRRGQYRATVSPTLKNLIEQHTAHLPEEVFAQVRRSTLEFAKAHQAQAARDPEAYVERVQSTFTEAVSTQIVAPVLALLDSAFRQASYSAVESVYEIETDLVATLTRPVLEQLPEPLNGYILRSDLGPVQEVLDSLFTEIDTERRMAAFFEDFATADAFQDLRDLYLYLRVGAEGMSLYLYFCDLKFRSANFPLFYAAATIALEEKQGSEEFVIEADPRLFVNKQAIDYIAQELKGSISTLALSPISQRIIYLAPERSFVSEMQSIVGRMRTVFDLSGEVTLAAPRLTSAESSEIKLTTAAFIAAFDSSDESTLNDYESLIASLDANERRAGELFENIVRGMILEEPASAIDQVEDGWRRLKIEDRLVAESPIAVNEEQRHVLKALEHPTCRYIIVQGPPGTGKSHTITAIAFDCIVKGRNVLILSDKREALDVVEDKLTDALSRVRAEDDFPNPILRLGRMGGTYNRLLSSSSQQKIRNHHRSQQSHSEELKRQREAKEAQLKSAIAKTVQAYSSVGLGDIAVLHRIEARLEAAIPGWSVRLQDGNVSDLAEKSKALGDFRSLIRMLALETTPKTALELALECRIEAGAHQAIAAGSSPELPTLSRWLSPSEQTTLAQLLAQYAGLRMPVFGYLFRGSRVAALNVQVVQLVQAGLVDLKRDNVKLERVLVAQKQIVSRLGGTDNDAAVASRIWQRLKSPRPPAEGAGRLLEFLEAFRAAFPSELMAEPKLTVGTMFRSIEDLVAFLVDSAQYAQLWSRVSQLLASVPNFDYVGQKTELEQLHVTRMTHEIDGRFVRFLDGHAATAKALGGVIKAKQRFPQDQFAPLKEAFPCIIAGIREFAEYIPLREALFDVVIIDEASQVSVAQAFPALLRSKKAVVFGDKHQFSNVKAATASNELNRGYLNHLEQFFRSSISQQSDRLQRLKHFDVKRSVLEFFELIRNYETMLKKHFRGYQELINFSSKHFYGDSLQAIKVRARPLDEVIRFTSVEPVAESKSHNVNVAEGKAILEELRRMIDEETGETVGVITPFREQQGYLSRLLFADAYAQRFEDELRLKIMTFDTCQGEERDVIIYSMVATRETDLLNYIFPVKIDNVGDRVEEQLKAQRLNVGFSRAKETMHFFVSKPVEEFKGSIGRALLHFKSTVEAGEVADPEQTDPRSPMERKVLDWIQKTAFFQHHHDRVAVTPQFRVGDYLKQLDPYYHHPAYRCDFLLRYDGDAKTVNVIIEYDGFEHHFENHSQVDASTYPAYYRPEDLERQLVLESYGYKFLRLNRFNMGRDPVTALSKRLEDLVASAQTEAESSAIKKLRETQEALAGGDAKHCGKCKKVKKLDDFFDHKLQGGKGSYGRICADCKAASAPAGALRFGRWR